MSASITDKKNELRRRAEAYSASLTREINDLAGSKSAPGKVMLAGMGLLLGWWALGRVGGISPGRSESRQTENRIRPDQTSLGQSGEAGLTSGYREKLTIIGLEILRRLLLFIIDHLFARDEKKHI